MQSPLESCNKQRAWDPVISTQLPPQCVATTMLWSLARLPNHMGQATGEGFLWCPQRMRLWQLCHVAAEGAARARLSISRSITSDSVAPPLRRRGFFPRWPVNPSFHSAAAQDTELSCVSLLCRPRFPAAVSPALLPLPSLPDGLLCGSGAEAPPPFCGITMAAGVGAGLRRSAVILSDAMPLPEQAQRRQRVLAE